MADATFTAKDQQQLDSLTYRKAVADWKAREDERKTKLALAEDLAKVFTAEKVQPFVDAASAARRSFAATDPTIGDMLGNIETVMGFSGMQVAYFVERLSVAEPEPAAPGGAPADADSESA